MPLVYTNPFLIRSGAYGTRSYGAGTGASLVERISGSVGLYIEGFAGIPYVAGYKGAFIEGSLFTALPNTPAFIRGIESTRIQRAAYISGPHQDRPSRSAFLHGHRVQVGSKTAYIYSYEDTVSGSTDVFLHGRQGIRSAAQRAFIKPWVPITSGRNAFIISIVGTSTDGQNVFVYGLAKEHFSHPSYVHIETPLTGAQPTYVQIETPVASSRGITIVASEQAHGYTPAFTYGRQPTSSSRAAYVQIETPMLSSAAAFIVGEPIVSSHQGFIAAPWMQAAYVHIETPIASLKRAYSRGHIGITNNKIVWVRGARGISSYHRAFVQVITQLQVSKTAYVHGPQPQEASRPSYISGIDSQRPSKGIYMFGHFVTVPSAIGAYIRIGEPATGSQACYIQIENPTEVSADAFTRGWISAEVMMRVFLDSTMPISPTPLGAFIQIQTPIQSLKRSFIQIENPMRAPVKRAFIRNVGSIQQPLLSYMFGANKLFLGKNCYIHLPTPQLAPVQRCFVEWRPTITSSVMCYVFETGLGNISQECYLNGTRVGEVDSTRKAFISGSNVGNHLLDIERFAYINGVVRTVAGSKSAFIVNYGLIGEWRLDDGQYDYGTAISNDYSTVDQDGFNVNFPEYVEGPYREDCSHA